MADFKWTESAEKAALALAEGETRHRAAVIAGVGERTLYRWLDIAEFTEEVDRLTFLTGVAQKAERLRLAKRIVKQLNYTKKDLLEWLKYIQGETDGIKLDFAELLTAINANGDKVADSGSDNADSAE